MRFPLKFALSAVLANTIAAEVAHSSQAQQLQNELDLKFQQQPQQQPQPTFRQAVQTDVNDGNGFDATRMQYPIMYSLPESMQYVAMPSQNAETDAINADSSNAVPTYAEPGSYPYTGFSNIVPYVGGNIGGGFNPGAFAVQSGYDGYLVPTKPEEKAVEPKSNNELPFIGAIQRTISSLTASLPTSMRATGSVVGQVITVIAGMLGLTVLGGTLTTAICTFTPLCTISFALPFARSSLRSLAEPLVGEQNADLLDSTLMRLSKMQTGEKDKLTAKSSPSNNGDDSVRAESIDAVAVKSVDGTDVTADIAGTIAKVAKVTKSVAAKASKTAPISTTNGDKLSVDNLSNDK